jgi:hypothetical protein
VTPPAAPLRHAIGISRLRALLGLALLLGATAYACATALWQAASTPPDPEAEAEHNQYDRERFASVKPLLPRAGVIGYRDEHSADSPGGTVLRFSQYVLAPVVLREDVDGPLVLVNGSPGAAPPEVNGGRLRLLHDAGNGVRLFGAGGP